MRGGKSNLAGPNGSLDPGQTEAALLLESAMSALLFFSCGAGANRDTFFRVFVPVAGAVGGVCPAAATGGSSSPLCIWRADANRWLPFAEQAGRGKDQRPASCRAQLPCRAGLAAGVDGPRARRRWANPGFPRERELCGFDHPRADSGQGGQGRIAPGGAAETGRPLAAKLSSKPGGGPVGPRISGRSGLRGRLISRSDGPSRPDRRASMSRLIFLRWSYPWTRLPFLLQLFQAIYGMGTIKSENCN